MRSLANIVGGKKKQKQTKQNKPGSLQKFLICAHNRRELRKNRSEPKESEKYKEVNNNIKRCMKKATQNWIGEQCSEIEEKSEDEQQ